MLLNFSPNALGPVAGDLGRRRDRRHGAQEARSPARSCFVGAIDSTLGDNKTAPVNKSTGIPGVLLHANAVNTMLTGTYLEPVPDSQTLLWVAVDHRDRSGSRCCCSRSGCRSLITLLVGFGYVVFAFIRFNSGHVHELRVPVDGGASFAFIGALGLRYFGETRQRRRVTALFSQYVPEAVAQRLVDEDRAGAAVEGERLDMTVLFCDLRGFTALSENLEPAIVRMMLNHYYDRVTDIVLAMDGTLMKYVGDEVFAVWGAPLPSDRPPGARARVRDRDPGAHARAQPRARSSRAPRRCRSASG